MLFQSKEHKSKTWLIIAGITIGITIIIVLIFGVRNIFKILLFLLEAIALLSILFGMGYLFYTLFIKKQRYDVTYVNKKKLMEAGRKNKLQNLKDLYLSGDKGHTRVNIGKIIGWCRIQTTSKSYIYKDIKDEEGETYKEVKTIKNERGEPTPRYNLESIEQDVFIVKNKGLAGLFADPMVIRVSPNEHDDLIGDITLRGLSLIPISEYWFLNTDYLDVRKVDYAILRESIRLIAFEQYRDMKELIDKAVGLDARHKKGIEEKNLVELPELQRIQR